ncbi:zinc finger C-x8-C-x5-C-x3-H type family protein [Actinidia rufa]|uniref:Zinc finger C-x8-C-x5-C-x3-H type family protein n=1 Tax=Actinidia rufa TaxID=165716 RepID=A0A7J0HFU6_9ERIC|nr:zinc finger C-x8-C-x5-C-x3-H type family protein [Actinidia rufa]
METNCQIVGSLGAGRGEYPERAGQPVCQYYMRTGTCKFGASCKYHHPRQGGGSAIPVALNYSGYPLRPGEKECSYYMKTGQCKFGVTCKFHHPQPAGIQVPAPTAGPFPVHGSAIYSPMQSPSVPSSQQYGVAAGNWPVARPALVPGSYLQGAYSPMLIPPGMVPFTGWNPYQAPVSRVASPSTQSTVGPARIYGITQLSPSGPSYPGAYLPLPSSTGPSSSSQKEHTFPERPGQPECQHYMKTGECKFGSSCRYHHPPEWSTLKTSFTLNPKGLPLRPMLEQSGVHQVSVENLGCSPCPSLPEHSLKGLIQMKNQTACAVAEEPRLCLGAPLCTHYAQNRVCKFGLSCKFDHPVGPMSCSSSASSLADMPVAPYPVGSSKGTLALSSSSSDLRPELISGSNKDTLSTRMSSSTSSSSGSVGSILSKSGPAPHPSVQQ